MVTEQHPISNGFVHADASQEQFQHLLGKAFQTLETILSNDALPTGERAQVALKILEFAGIAGRDQTPYITALQTDNLLLQSEILAQTLPQQETVEPLTVNSTVAHYATPAAPSSISAAKQTTFLPAHCVQIDDFLTPDENAQALDIALTREAEFVGSSTTTKATDYRQSSILYATLFPDFYHFLRQKILTIVPSILQQLNHPPFSITEVEMQLTAHNDGCYYKIHNDSGSEVTATRELTYVYYFYRQPQQFSGGELRIYDTDLLGSAITESPNFKSVEPRNNSIVLFDSRCKHEVMPVRCPSRAFTDSRFTLNGWLRRPS